MRTLALQLLLEIFLWTLFFTSCVVDSVAAPATTAKEESDQKASLTFHDYAKLPMDIQRQILLRTLPEDASRIRASSRTFRETIASSQFQEEWFLRANDGDPWGALLQAIQLENVTAISALLHRFHALFTEEAGSKREPSVEEERLRFFYSRAMETTNIEVFQALLPFVSASDVARMYRWRFNLRDKRYALVVYLVRRDALSEQLRQDAADHAIGALSSNFYPDLEKYATAMFNLALEHGDIVDLQKAVRQLIMKGRIEQVEALRLAGADLSYNDGQIFVDALGRYGCSIATARYLLQHGIAPTHLEGGNPVRSVIRYAVFSRQYALAAYLLQTGLIPHLHIYRALLDSIVFFKTQWEETRWYLENAKVDINKNNGELFRLALEGFLRHVKLSSWISRPSSIPVSQTLLLLLNHGVNLSQYGKEALTEVVRMGHVPLAKLLLEKGAPVGPELSQIATSNRDPEMLALLNEAAMVVPE